MKLHFFVILPVFLLILSGCHQPNPHPETLDPIYSDIEKEKKDIDGAYSAEKKQLEEFQKALLEVKPQTGQIKYAEKRLFESKARLEKLDQRRIYLELRLKTRKDLITKEYLAAFEKDLPWPDPKEYQTYKSQKDLESAPRTWSVGNRLEKASPPKKPAGGGGEHH